MDPDAEAVSRFRRAGGMRQSVRGGTKVCWDHDREAAVRTVHERWPNMFLPGEPAQVLPTPAHFEQASQLVTEQQVREGSIVCGDDVEAHVSGLQAYAEAGFDAVYVNQIGPDMRGFFDFYGREVLPRLQG